MEAQLILNPKNLRKYNFTRYKGVQPSNELIQKVVKKSGLKFLAKFEIVWGMPRDVLTLSLNGHRNLPPKYWHIFYDFDIVNQMYSNLDKKRTSAVKKPSILPSNKTLLNGLRTK